MNNKSFTEQEWSERKAKLRKEIPFVDIKEYSHNLITAYLNDMTDEQATRMISECGLGRIGWDEWDKGYDAYEVNEAEQKINEQLYKKREKLLKKI